MAAQPKKKTVYVSMLGKFELTVGDTVVSDNLNRSSRIWNLLAYLIINRSRTISQAELIEALWSNDDYDNPANALKSLVYRVRTMLSTAFGAELQFIVSTNGSYSWNPDYACIVDIEEFSNAAFSASNSSDDAIKIKNYTRATELYVGDFLPRLASEMWVIPLSIHYHNMYLEAVKEYASMLIDSGNPKQSVSICQNALLHEMYDEGIHLLLMRAYLKMGSTEAAIGQYKSASDFFYRNLGVRPSGALKNLYCEILEQHDCPEIDLYDVVKELDSFAIKEGAFVCDFEYFKEAYTLESRWAARSGTCAHLAMITIHFSGNADISHDVIEMSVKRLMQIVVASMRKSDVVTRYANSNLLVLLPTANLENSDRLIRNIIERFTKVIRSHYISVTYKLSEINCSI